MGKDISLYYVGLLQHMLILYAASLLIWVDTEAWTIGVCAAIIILLLLPLDTIFCLSKCKGKENDNPSLFYSKEKFNLIFDYD